METKIYKNENMIRTKHNVSRVIYCNGLLEVERFIVLYEDKFDKIGKINPQYHSGRYGVGGTITKAAFDEIVKALGLTKVKGTSKNRYWQTETAQV